MSKLTNRKEQTKRRHQRLRKRVTGTADRPRLAVFRSSKHIYAQVIDDVTATTLVSTSSLSADVKGSISTGADIKAAQAVGADIASKAKKQGIETIVFDRGGNVYRGRVAALAEAAREGGLVF